MSIKKKLAAAIATSALLAGLFGSAFVPVALAQDPGKANYTVTCTGEDTNSESGLPAAFLAFAGTTDTDGECNFLSTVTPTLVVTVNNVDDTDDGNWDLTVSGGTIKSIAITADADGGTTSTTVAVGNGSATVNLIADAGEDQGFIATVVLNKIAAGADATLTVTNSDDADVIVVTVEGLASSLKNVVSEDFSTVDTDSQDVDDEDLATENMLYVMAEDLVVADSGEIAVDVETVYDANPVTQPLITATVTGDLLVSVTTAGDCDAVTEAEYDTSYSALADGDNTVCLIGANGDATDAGAATVKIVAGGVTLLDADVTILGYVTDIVATKGMTYIATGADIDGNATLNGAKLTYKDAAGGNLNTLCVAAAEVCASIDAEYDDLVTFKRDPGTGTYAATARVDVGDAADFAGALVASADGYISYDDVCNGADSGDVYNIKATYENEDEEDIDEIWDVKCTDSDGIITNIAGEAASAAPGAQVDVLYTVTDSEGLPCGYGCQVTSDGDITVTLQPAGGTAATEIRDAAGDALAAADFDDALVEPTIVDGAGSVTVKMPTTAGNYAFVVDYADVGDGETEESWTVRFTVTNVAAAPTSQALTAGPKKLKATADFGISAAGAKIAFTLEKSNGTVKTYYRKANASGVATFTLRFRGTFEVTASFGDYITDTVILRKK